MKVMNFIAFFTLFLKVSKGLMSQTDEKSYIRCEYVQQYKQYFECDMEIFNKKGLEFDEIEGTFPSQEISMGNIIQVNIVNQTTMNIPSIICAAYPNLLVLKVLSSGLTNFDSKAFEKCANLTTLKISKNNFKIIPIGSFVHLNKLNKLELTENQIERISAETFTGAEAIQYLSLELNSLSEIPLDTFNDLKHLLKLNISHNHIARLDSKSFGYSLLNLFTIHAQGNHINEIDPLFFEAKQRRLRYLYLTDNECINEDFDGIFNLEYIEDRVKEQLNNCFRNFLENINKLSGKFADEPMKS